LCLDREFLLWCGELGLGKRERGENEGRERQNRGVLREVEEKEESINLVMKFINSLIELGALV